MATALLIYCLLSVAVCLAVIAYATHSYTLTWANGSQSVSSQSSYTGNTEKNYDAAIPTGTVNQLADITIIRANMQSAMILSDQNITLKTNSTGAPQDTIAVVANVPIFFRINDGRGNIFAGDVTAMYISNASGSTANVTMRFLETP